MTLCGLLLGLGSEAYARMTEEVLIFPTDGLAPHLFPLNPAYTQIGSLRGGVALAQTEREVELDQSNAGDPVISNESSEDYVNFGIFSDLGAGAGLGLFHQTLYRETETTFDQFTGAPRKELAKIQHSAARLVVELTADLRAGLVIRYLYDERSVFGNPFLPDGLKTDYNTTMFGYGAGGAYRFKNGSISYSYYPPLRGKSEIYGEELILVEPGQIAVDAHYDAGNSWTFGASVTQWIHEIDDRAEGTTADDDETSISLYGLDVDQYLFPEQRLMAGVGYESSNRWSVRGAIGREEGEFNFEELALYQGVGVRPGGRPAVQTDRVRVAVRFVNGKMTLHAGAGLWEREHTFSNDGQSVSYDASGREVFATAGMKL